MGKLRVGVLLMLAACGRLGFDDQSNAPTLPPGPPEQRTLQICGSSDWTTVAARSDDDLSIAVTPTGVAVFSAPASGGDLHGAMFDHAQHLVTNATVRTGPYTASAAAYVDGELIAAVVSSSRVLVNFVPDTVDAFTEIANVDGIMVGKQALMHASADRMTPTACSAGLTINPFSAAWAATPSQLAVVTDLSTGIGATPIDGQAQVVWSTMGGECHVERVMDNATGIGSKQQWPCRAPRVAYNAASGQSTMLFEETDGVRLASISSDMISSTSVVVVPGATSPRILDDGTRTWVAYLAASGNLEVGAFNGDGSITTVDTGVAPGHDAFELTTVDGELWAYAIANGHYDATHVCLQ
jgi:hypothetical protein